MSAQYIRQTLKELNEFNFLSIEIGKDGKWRLDGEDLVFLDFNRYLAVFTESTGETELISIDAVIPCLHGFPGETGDIQSYFDMINIPYMASNAEASRICFNKAITKLWLKALNIPTSDFIFVTDTQNLKPAQDFFKKHGDIFIKAASQGSSVGCYHITQESDLIPGIIEAFKYSEYVLLEKTIKGRELEVSVYQYNNEIRVSRPGEIICPNKFYSYEEKYSSESKTQTITEANNLTEQQILKIQEYALKLFQTLHIRHLARIDFFLEDNTGEILLNEPNTFPGLTPISMFPKMMEASGDSFKTFLHQILQQLLTGPQ